MKIRTDFVTNSSSSSFTLNLMIELKNGKKLRYEALGYEEPFGPGEYAEVSAMLSPKELAECPDIAALVDKLKDSIECYGEPILTDDDKFIQKVKKIPSMQEIAKISVTGTEVYDPENEYAQVYTYDCMKQAYTCEIDGEQWGAINGASGGNLYVPDRKLAKEANEMDEALACEADKVQEKGKFVVKYGVLVRYTGEGGQVTIPDGVQEIGSNAFDDCLENLTGITFPEGFTTIQERAFEGTALTSVTIPGGVKEVPNAFEGCMDLIEVILSEGVEEIACDAFADCESLRDVTLPASVTEIDDCAFYGCPLFTIHAPAGSYAEQFAKEKGYPFEAL